MVERRPIEVVGAAVTRFVGLLPAFLLAMLCLRAAELGAGMPAGAGFAETIRISAWALAGDAYVLARFLPLLLLLSLAPVLSSSGHAVFWSLGLIWSALVAVQAALIQYFVTARVPLGADLYAYSLRDVHETVAAGLRLYPAVLAGTLLALLILWAGLARLLRRERPLLSQRAAAWIMAAAVVLWVGSVPVSGTRSEKPPRFLPGGGKAAEFLSRALQVLMHRRDP